MAHRDEQPLGGKVQKEQFLVRDSANPFLLTPCCQSLEKKTNCFLDETDCAIAHVGSGWKTRKKLHFCIKNQYRVYNTREFRACSSQVVVRPRTSILIQHQCWVDSPCAVFTAVQRKIFCSAPEGPTCQLNRVSKENLAFNRAESLSESTVMFCKYPKLKLSTKERTRRKYNWKRRVNLFVSINLSVPAWFH